MKCSWHKVRLKINGEWRTFQNLKDATVYFNIPYSTVFLRIKKGMSVPKALRTPARRYTPHPYAPKLDIEQLLSSLNARRKAMGLEEPT